MAKTVRKVCRCGTVFYPRAADVARGWGKFCSKSCKAKEQEKRTGQYSQLIRESTILERDEDIGYYENS